MAIYGNTIGEVAEPAVLDGLIDSQDDQSTAEKTIDPALIEEVRTGLQQTPKRLSSRFFYDAEGSRIFQDIMHAPEYYLTRSEYEILDSYKADLLDLFAVGDRSFDLVELGAGDGLKTKLLLSHFVEEQADFAYAPVDISVDALNGLVADVRRSWPSLRLNARHDDYFNALAQLSEESDSRRVVLFLGSNIGNFTPDEAVDFYRQLHHRLRPGDLVLTGIDLQKHPAVIHAAYNDRQGLTRAFNLNLLRRLNRDLDANFDLAAFDHYETYSPETGEARSYLVSQKAQTVRIDTLDMTVPFAYGEIIHTEISRKFTPAQIEQLAQQTGFRVVRSFTDCKGYFTDVVFEKV